MTIVTFFVISLALPFAHAQTDCKDVKNYQKIIECAELRSPEVREAQMELDQARQQIRAAGQWRNPELGAESFSGKVGTENRSETDISLGVPIELGGKISARENVAKGQAATSEARLFESRSKVRTQVLLKLHRLRQVLHEQEIVDEAIGTFSKLVNQYAKRPALAPEQQISASVFQLSKGDYDLKKVSNADEILELDSFFKLNVGLGIDEIKKNLPHVPKAWPSIQKQENNRPSPRQRVLEAEVQTANAELSQAQSEAWPTLTVGPSIKMVKENGMSDQMMGFNVSLPLPIFNLNGGARSAAAAGVKLSETRRQIGLRGQELKRLELVRVYEQSVKILQGSLSHEEIEKRHTDAEKLFTRGVVPSALVIEAHRTSYELERTRHERELKALEALLNIYSIDGVLLEVNL